MKDAVKDKEETSTRRPGHETACFEMATESSPRYRSADHAQGFCLRVIAQHRLARAVSVIAVFRRYIDRLPGQRVIE
jgi:hypothetical protein